MPRTFIRQAGKILDVSTLEVFNNTRLGGLTLLEELAPIFASSSANQLLAKDVFGKRMEGGNTLAIMEMLYPLMQAHDSLSVKADIELGGSDQRFNVLMGRQMQSHFGQEPQVVMLTPILMGTCGEQKMSKSFDNFIALDDEPNDVFGKVMRIPDRLILEYTRLATVLKPSQIEAARKRSRGGRREPNGAQARMCDASCPFHSRQRRGGRCAGALGSRASSEEVPADMPSHVVAVAD